MSEKKSKAESAMMGGERFSLRFKGTMTALSPISIVTPNGPQIPMDSGDGKAAEVATIAVVAPSGEVVRVPVVTGTTIKSKLRHAAVRCALPFLGEKPLLPDYLYSAIGGVKGDEKEDSFDIVERDLRRMPNPVIGLFGAAAPWDGSRASVSNAIPDLARGYDPKSLSQLSTSTRRDPFAANPGLAAMLDPSAVPEYLGQRSDTRSKVDAEAAVRAAGLELSKAIDAGNEPLAAEIRERLKGLKDGAAKAKKDAGNSILMPHAHRYIPQGVVFTHKMTLLDVTAVEAGLFLAALDSVFRDDPLFGGKVGLHYGEVSAEWTVRVRDAGGWRPAGTIEAEPFEPVAIGDAQLAGFGRAWEEFAASGALDLAKRVPERKTRKKGGAKAGAEEPEEVA